jgi:hypothetical protein
VAVVLALSLAPAVRRRRQIVFVGLDTADDLLHRLDVVHLETLVFQVLRQQLLIENRRRKKFSLLGHHLSERYRELPHKVDHRVVLFLASSGFATAARKNSVNVVCEGRRRYEALLLQRIVPSGVA